ncbi:unnamed protein product [Nesidiocoris tenuis]|uniref:Uncharacterized protein n=1 Tax=Nesidiocoris tenuis TaxID=355587 RepID=A0A6H5GP16_9HEMI|nr:unnamed protein product [Nesidiocoris tenuis]
MNQSNNRAELHRYPQNDEGRLSENDGNLQGGQCGQIRQGCLYRKSRPGPKDVSHYLQGSCTPSGETRCSDRMETTNLILMSVSFGGVITYPNSNNNNIKDEKSLKNRFNCGILRSSLKINGSFISIRLVSSKLRKREDGSVVTTNNNSNHQNQNTTVIEAEVRTPPPTPAIPLEPPPFLWRYSTSSQFSLSNTDQHDLSRQSKTRSRPQNGSSACRI